MGERGLKCLCSNRVARGEMGGQKVKESESKSRIVRLCLDPEFGEGKGNENGKGRRFNRSGPLDHLPFPFPLHFSSPIP